HRGAAIRLRALSRERRRHRVDFFLSAANRRPSSQSSYDAEAAIALVCTKAFFNDRDPDVTPTPSLKPVEALWTHANGRVVLRIDRDGLANDLFVCLERIAPQREAHNGRNGVGSVLRVQQVSTRRTKTDSRKEVFRDCRDADAIDAVVPPQRDRL